MNVANSSVPSCDNAGRLARWGVVPAGYASRTHDWNGTFDPVAVRQVETALEVKCNTEARSGPAVPQLALPAYGIEVAQDCLRGVARQSRRQQLHQLSLLLHKRIETRCLVIE